MCKKYREIDTNLVNELNNITDHLKISTLIFTTLLMSQLLRVLRLEEGKETPTGSHLNNVMSKLSSKQTKT